jgi:hypothetical protein
VDRSIHPNFSERTTAYDFLLLKLNYSALVDVVYNPQEEDPTTTTNRGNNSTNTNITTDNISTATATTRQGPTPTTTTTTMPTGLKTIPINRHPLNPQPNDQLKVMGFGVTDVNDAELVNDLMAVNVFAVDEQTCADFYGYGIEPESMFCAGDVQAGGADSCQGTVIKCMHCPVNSIHYTV